MALFTVADVLKEARQVYLNDTLTGEIFTDDVLMPYIVRAFDELNSKLARFGHQVTEGALFHATIPAGIVFYDPMLAVPPVTDVLEPLVVEERGAGGTEDEWIEMDKVNRLPSRTMQQTLGVWNYHQNRIAFIGATTDRDILIRYIRFLPALTVTTDQPVVRNSKSFLSARTAALAAGHIGANAEKAAYIQLDADMAFDDLSAIAINADQASPVRRRPFRR